MRLNEIEIPFSFVFQFSAYKMFYLTCNLNLEIFQVYID